VQFREADMTKPGKIATYRFIIDHHQHPIVTWCSTLLILHNLNLRPNPSSNALGIDDRNGN
jgi:hypothetical protein